MILSITCSGDVYGRHGRWDHSRESARSRLRPGCDFDRSGGGDSVRPGQCRRLRREVYRSKVVSETESNR